MSTRCVSLFPPACRVAGRFLFSSSFDLSKNGVPYSEANGFAPKLFEAAPPPDVRRDFTSPAALTGRWGFAPGLGHRLRFWAKGRTTGIGRMSFTTSTARQAAPHIKRRSRKGSNF
jgi:hypothetical protein